MSTILVVGNKENNIVSKRPDILSSGGSHYPSYVSGSSVSAGGQYGKTSLKVREFGKEITNANSTIGS